jgi:hypothetical protein
VQFVLAWRSDAAPSPDDTGRHRCPPRDERPAADWGERERRPEGEKAETGHRLTSAEHGHKGEQHSCAGSDDL